jgi:very-short-patch-repair endonuclease
MGGLILIIYLGYLKTRFILPDKNSNYNKNLKTFAKDLRNDSTKGEIILWKKVLRAKTIFNYQFNRQFPMYLSEKSIIVDFICRKLKLIIEIDGYSHKFKTKKDRDRDEKLSKLGYHVLRFEDRAVRNALTDVVIVIDSKIKELENGL